MYTQSNELEEIGIVTLTGVNVESDPLKESLLGVSLPARVGDGGSSTQFNPS